MSEINISTRPDVVNVRGSLVGEKSILEEKGKGKLGKKEKADLEKSKTTLAQLDTFVRDVLSTFEVEDNATLNVKGTIEHDSINLSLTLTVGRYNRTDWSEAPVENKASVTDSILNKK